MPSLTLLLPQGWLEARPTWSLPRRSTRSWCMEGSGLPVPTTRCRLPTVSRGGCKTSSGPASEVQGGPSCILLVQQIVKLAQISGEGKRPHLPKGGIPEPPRFPARALTTWGRRE